MKTLNFEFSIKITKKSVRLDKFVLCDCLPVFGTTLFLHDPATNTVITVNVLTVLNHNGFLQYLQTNAANENVVVFEIAALH